MKKIISLILLSLFVASCAQTSNGVNSGFIYTSWKDRDPISRVDNSVPANKSGKACVKSTLGLVATGDSSIDAAMKNGDIKKVSYVDRTFEAFNIYIPIFQEGCTVVYGN
ncbi:MAG: TRL-like family protein [Rickettsiales bacterium]